MLETSTAAPARPSVLSLAVKEKSMLHAAYMPYLINSGIFVPTTRPYNLGDEIYLILTLMDDATKYPVAGKVVWITPANAHNNKPQGVGLQFPADETGQRLRQRIEEILGGSMASNRSTHTL